MDEEALSLTAGIMQESLSNGFGNDRVCSNERWFDRVPPNRNGQEQHTSCVTLDLYSLPLPCLSCPHVSYNTATSSVIASEARNPVRVFLVRHTRSSRQSRLYSISYCVFKLPPWLLSPQFIQHLEGFGSARVSQKLGSSTQAWHVPSAPS